MRITEKAKYDEYNRRTKIRTSMAEIDDGYEYIIGRNQKRFITSRVMRKVMNLIYIYNLCFLFFAWRLSIWIRVSKHVIHSQIKCANFTLEAYTEFCRLFQYLTFGGYCVHLPRDEFAACFKRVLRGVLYAAAAGNLHADYSYALDIVVGDNLSKLSV